jgi:uncharacterized membrane protein
MHYFPLGIGQAILFAALLAGLLLLQIIFLRRAYWALGLDPRMATLVLFGSLLGSSVNLPLVRLPEERVVARRWWRSSASRSWRRLRSTGRARFSRSTSAAR